MFVNPNWKPPHQQQKQADDAAPAGPSEDDKVEANVTGHFERLGFTSVAAGLLARWHADWHAAEKMLRAGASHPQVFKILKP